MTLPLVSVIVPAYNGAGAIGDAIRSVLDQTYPHFELLVADDCSTDETRAVVGQFGDPRVRLLTHATNQGPDAARFTALSASSGEIVAFLDQDDLFLPGKLAAHVEHMASHPEVGLSYNPFFLLTEPGHRVQLISRPPSSVSLADLVLGFPLPPSTWVFRRAWALLDEIWDPMTMLRGREVVLLGRLFVAGCRFSMVDEVLNQRRIHAGRRYEHPAAKCAAERRCQELMLTDPRCTDDARAVRDQAEANAWLVWANVALAQGEGDCGRELLRHAVRLDPGLLGGAPNRLADYLVGHAVTEAVDAEDQLRRVFGQLADEVPVLPRHLDWAVTQAHLLLAARHVIWERPADATPHWKRLEAIGGLPDDVFLRRIAHEILTVEEALGRPLAHEALGALSHALASLAGRPVGRRLRGIYRLMRAFHQYSRGAHQSVPIDVLGGMLGDPRELANRGAWSILLRSAVQG